MGFFGSLFSGSDPTLTGDISNAGNVMNFGTALGEKDLGAGSNFYNTLLSGDPEAIGKLLAPQISTIQQQGQQQLNTGAQFGNRSGGTNAANQTNMDTQRQNVERMIAQLTGNAAGAVTGIGESALGTGLNANQIQEQESQDRLQNVQNSLFGQLLTQELVGGLKAAQGAAAAGGG